MNQTFKKKMIAVSIAAAFGLGAGMTLVADAQANMFSDTTQAATAATVPTVTASTAALVPLTGQTFTLTESAAGAFTASPSVSNGSSFVSLTLSNAATGGAPTFELTGQTTNTTTSTGFKVSAPTFIGIAASTLRFTPTPINTGDAVNLGINGDAWIFSAGTTVGGSVPVTVFKNGVAQSTTGVSTTATYLGMAGLIATTMNSAYGSGTATAQGDGGQLVLVSSNAYFNTALTGGGAASYTDATSDITATTVGTIALASAPSRMANTATAIYTPSIRLDGADPTAAGNTALMIPILKNNATSAGTITLSKMSVMTNASTLGDIKIKVSANSTTAGVSKGSSTVIATAAATKVTGSFGTAATAAPGSTVTAPDITLVENLPGALKPNGTVVFTLPTGATWTYANASVSATSAGGTTVTGTLTGTGTTALTFTVTAATTSTSYPSTVKISGANIVIASTVTTGTAINAVVTQGSNQTGLDAGLLATTGYNVANVQSGTMTAALSGTAPTVYTQRTYAAGINGGALTAGVTLAENTPGAIAANTSLNLDLTNSTFVNTATGLPDFGGTTTNAFGLTGGGASNSYATVVTAGGYNAAGTTFTNGAATWTVSTASSALTNTRKVTFPGLIVGNTVGAVTAKLTSNTLGAGSTITIANAVKATDASVSGSLASPVLNGSAVSLPTIVISETAAGALATSTGGPGNVSLTLTNATFDTSATAKWCGSAITSSNITGGNTTALTINLPAVSTSKCQLEVTSAAKANLSAAAGAGITATVNTSLADTAQASRQEVVVGSVGTTTTGTGSVTMSIPAATVTGASSAQTIVGSVTPSSSDLGTSGSVFVAAILPSSMGGGVYFLTPPSTWTLYNGTATPGAYSTGTLAAVPTVTITSAMNVSTLVGTDVYVGYGKSNVFAPASSAFNSMLDQNTYSKVYTIK